MALQLRYKIGLRFLSSSNKKICLYIITIIIIIIIAGDNDLLITHKHTLSGRVKYRMVTDSK